MVTFEEQPDDDTMATIYNVVNTHKFKWPILEINKKLSNFSFTSTQKFELEELLSSAGDNTEVERKFDEIIKKCKTP